MPIIWKYLLQSYLKIFSCSIFTFIAILIVSRFKEIARFAALCGGWHKIILFTAYQIPCILPFAFPISAVLSAFVLMHRLSQNSECTALRTSGFSLRTMLTPLLLTSSFLALIHFIICASIAPYCNKTSKILLYQETSRNPLLLLQRQNLSAIRHAYLSMDVKKEGKATDHLFFITYNAKANRLQLFTANKLRITKELLVGHDVAVVINIPDQLTNEFDSVFIENQSFMSTEAPILSLLLKKYRPKVDVNGLNLQMLLLRTQERNKQSVSAYIEIARKISLGISVFTCTLLGCAFGLHHRRNFSRKNTIAPFFLTLFFIIAYLGLKACKHFSPSLLITTALLPHAFILVISILRIFRFAGGKKT